MSDGGGELSHTARAADEVEFTFAGERVRARRDQSIAMALWADGRPVLRNSSKQGEPRGVLCNMGVCYECLVRIEGEFVRACMTVVRPGLDVQPGGKP